MARRSPRPEATQEKTLIPLKESCEQCGQPLLVARHNHRTVLQRLLRKGLQARLYRCGRHCSAPHLPPSILPRFKERSTKQWRFRKDLAAYLAALETQLLM